MDRESKCKLAIEKGYKYNSETGDVISPYGKIIIRKHLGYIAINIRNKNNSYNLRVHQLAWYIIYGECVDYIDHINGIKDDNRISNLRSVTNQENTFNNKKAKGYTKIGNKWRSLIKLNNKSIHLGYHNTKEARQAYLEAKENYHKI